MNRGGPKATTTNGRGGPTRTTPASNNQASRTTEGRHIPREFKYTVIWLREQFLRKLQACSTPLDFNDETKQVREKSDRQAYLQ